MHGRTIDTALTDLHRRHQAELVGHARRLLSGDHAAAEDLVQDAFLATMRVLDAEPERPVLTRPWLYRLVHNASLDELRCARRRHDAGPPADIASSDREPCATLIERADLRDAVARVVALPPAQQRALVLHAVEGHDHDTVAAMLDISREASRALVHRARRSLRR